MRPCILDPLAEATAAEGRSRFPCLLRLTDVRWTGLTGQLFWVFRLLGVHAERMTQRRRRDPPRSHQCECADARTTGDANILTAEASSHRTSLLLELGSRDGIKLAPGLASTQGNGGMASAQKAVRV